MLKDVVLDQVVFAGAHQSDAEIVTGTAWQSRESRAVPTVCVQPNSVVVAAGESCSAAGESGRSARVSDRNVLLDVAVGCTRNLNSAETIMRDSDMLNRCFSRSW